jgi:nicotinamide-nucleotide amidase
MTAEVVSVGTELLLGQTVDTHAATMGKILAECGVACYRRTTVGDNFDRLCAVFRESLERADVVIAIGGLGPTMDDLTRDAIAHVLEDEMERVPEVETQLRELFSKRNLRWTDTILRQADKPKCGRLLDNPNGTAPGLICEKGGKTIIALPGPRGEFNPMANGPVREFLAAKTGAVIRSVILRVVGMGESHVEDLVRPLMERETPTVAPYAHTGEVHLRVTAKAPTAEEADRILQPTLDELRAILGKNIFAYDATTLEEALVQALAARGATVAVAESMTGGELAARLSTAPGSSAIFRGGVTCYTAAAKSALLGVSPQLLAQHGPVSAEAAQAMASSVRDTLGATFGLSITGNAGPTSDEGGKPVGLVYIALATAEGVEVREQTYRGLRAEIRRRATQTALTWLRDGLV